MASEKGFQNEYDKIHAVPFHTAEIGSSKKLPGILLILSDIFIMLIPLLLLAAIIGVVASSLCGGFDQLSHCPSIVNSVTIWCVVAAGIALIIGMLLKVMCHFMNKK